MDCETGEITNEDDQIKLGSSYFDVETGEIVHDETLLPQQSNSGQRNRTRFTVPKAYLVEPTEVKKQDNKCYLSTQETFTLTSKKKVIELKEVIIIIFLIKISSHVHQLKIYAEKYSSYLFYFVNSHV